MNGYARIGRILRAHGTTGELVVDPELDLTEVLGPDRLAYLTDPRGGPVPVRVGALRPVSKGDRLSFFLTLTTVTTRTDAEKLKGRYLFLPEDELPEYEDEEAALDGYRLIGTDGTEYGTVLDVMENPAHPLLEVAGPNGRFFVPWVDAYVLEIDDDEATITVADLTALMEL